MQQSMRNVGIKEIAEALNISIGTVDRALHGRPGISPKTRDMVLEKSREFGYRPNYAARSLKLNRKFQLAVFLPREYEAFFDAICDGIVQSSHASSDISIEPHIFRYPRLDDGDQLLLTAHMAESWDACIVAPGNPARIEPILRRMSEAGTPVFCVATDAPGTGRIAAVTVDAYTSGAIAAELLSHAVKTSGSVGVVTGELSTLDHAEKVKGLRDGLSRWAPHLRLPRIVETHEQEKNAYLRTVEMLESSDRPVAIYVTTAMSGPVLRACAEHGMLGKLCILTTDLFEELIPYLETGAVIATLYQRPTTQGSLIVEQIARYLRQGELERHQIKLAPHLVMRSNLELFRHDVSAGRRPRLSNDLRAPSEITRNELR